MRLRLQCDGGSRGNPGRAGAGSTLSDAGAVIHGAGEEIAARWEFIASATNNVAEYRGLINGLELAKEVGERRGVAPADVAVDVFMDSKLIVEQMNGRWKIKHPDMKPLAAEAKKLQGQLASVSFTWVPRAQNKRADELANRAMDDGESGQWFSQDVVSEQGAETERQGAGTEPQNTDAQPQETSPDEHDAQAMAVSRTRFVFVACGTTTKEPPAGGLTPRAQRSVEYLASRGRVDAVYPVGKSARKAAQEMTDQMGRFAQHSSLRSEAPQLKECADLERKSSTKIEAAMGSIEEKLPGKTIALVGHPDALARLIGWVLGSVRTASSRIYLDDGSLSIAEWMRGKDTTPMLRRLNDVHHLR
ncbi:reverse transcriptase-like protein [Corynebacterium sp. 320]|nr:reverse transcriptase-like protein [Corynebacterium sp. 320]KAB1551534.1 reverse transcriptase-like protein [Corynebacterium sp. 321]KAB1551999.1 reverse transcriptase-like protein [Corynebacterium sp. 319]KAB3526199.1 reverse transcriptase-like protein [Corynebacterium sp. 250]KAB3538993.1 reverse transcriptase-like protein [Corynebacterium sp. 366]QNP93168.1 reverse transcriptase-like protein [Corynebacterium zhongnanshanii]